MGNRDIRERTGRLFKENFSAVFMACLLLWAASTLINFALTLPAASGAFEAFVMSLSGEVLVTEDMTVPRMPALVSLQSVVISVILQFAFVVCLSRIVKGQKVSMGFIFEYIADVPHLKRMLSTLWRLVLWAVLIVIAAAAGIMLSMLFAMIGPIIFIAAYIAVVIAVLVFAVIVEGGMMGSAFFEDISVGEAFSAGMRTAKENLGRIIKMMLSYIPISLIGVLPAFIYYNVTGQVDAVYVGLAIFGSLFSYFAVSPIMSMAMLHIIGDVRENGEYFDGYGYTDGSPKTDNQENFEDFNDTQDR